MQRAALLLALMTAACASGQPAPIAYGGGGGGASAPAPRSRPPVEIRNAPRPQQQQQQQQRTQPQEPVRTPQSAGAPAPEPNWAEGEGTPLSAYALRPEEAQPYDPARWPRTHRVQADESLYDIAARYQSPLRALIDQNNLEPPYALSTGRELQLPPPRFHRIARGETLRDVAEQYNVDFRSLALLNRMQPPYEVRAGDSIVLPAMARAFAPEPAPPTPSPSVALPPPSAAARFALPLRGEIVGRFGAQVGGGRLDGIEIAGREGEQITAAADGEVFYAGSDLAAYGTLVLVRHADGYTTAYAHARGALVREGDQVRAGQPLAELGSRADGRARLLFQVRRGAEVIDPTPLLRR